MIYKNQCGPKSENTKSYIIYYILETHNNLLFCVVFPIHEKEVGRCASCCTKQKPSKRLLGSKHLLLLGFTRQAIGLAFWLCRDSVVRTSLVKTHPRRLVHDERGTRRAWCGNIMRALIVSDKSQTAVAMFPISRQKLLIYIYEPPGIHSLTAYILPVFSSFFFPTQPRRQHRRYNAVIISSTPSN